MRRPRVVALTGLLLAFAVSHGAAQSIDSFIDARLAEAHVTAAPRSSDEAFLRRVTLDLHGRLPSVSEVTDFLSDSASDKRPQKIESLLNDPRFASRLARVWRSILLPETANNLELRYLESGFEKWLEGEFERGAGFDEVVRGILAAPISDSPTKPTMVLKDLKSPNPLAFLSVKEVEPAKLASTTTRVFLGMRLECAECHNHPFDSWTQEQFWSQAAFFSGLQRRGESAFAPIIEDRKRTSIAMSDSSKRQISARFLSGDEPSADPAEPARLQLAAWITQPGNPYFSKAIANRVWGLLLGRGIVSPVDDFHVNNPPSHPELLDFLAQEFQQHRFSVKSLYRAICNSNVYQRTSKQTDPGQSDARLFAKAIVKTLSTDQSISVFSTAVGVERNLSASGEQQGIAEFRRIAEGLFPAEEGESEPLTSISQSLMLMNGAFAQRYLDPAKNRLLAAAFERSEFNSQVEHLYLALLSRKPTAQELELIEKHRSADDSANARERLADVYWALLNSAEFRWNH